VRLGLVFGVDQVRTGKSGAGDGTRTRDIQLGSNGMLNQFGQVGSRCRSAFFLILRAECELVEDGGTPSVTRVESRLEALGLPLVSRSANRRPKGVGTSSLGRTTRAELLESPGISLAAFPCLPGTSGEVIALRAGEDHPLVVRIELGR